MENILTIGEFVKVDRSPGDEEDLDRAAAAARDMDRIAVTRNSRAAAARLKFDLDLPAEAYDDQVVGEGVRLPEWDWKRQRLQPDHCRVVTLLAAALIFSPLLQWLDLTALSHFTLLEPPFTSSRGIALAIKAGGTEIKAEKEKTDME